MALDWHNPPGALIAALKRQFGPRAYAIPSRSGARTGLYLWTLTREPGDYPVLPDTIQALIRRTSGQARIEICAPHDAATIPGFYEYDARWMYVACLSEMPSGDYRHCTEPAECERAYSPYHRGRYRVRFRVPEDWGHIGLFMVAANERYDGWHYPRAGTHETWCGWTELLLARDRGWHIELLESLTWPGRGPGPLDVWRDRLLRVADDAPEYRAWVRDILIHTVGAFHSRGREETHVIPRERLHEVPAGTLDVRPLSGGRIQYTTNAPLPEHLRKFQHPEWSADVWARCRTRLLYYPRKERGRIVGAWGALTVAARDVLALRTDAVYLASDPEWPDGGEPGAMRLRRAVTRPVGAPHSWDEIAALRALADREGVRDE